MKILCFGSLNIDYVYKVDHFVQKGETLSSDSLQVFSGGGGGLNQSIALARSGVEVYHAGSIGEDGKFLLTQLQEAGVNTDYVNILKTVRTGNAIIQNDKAGDTFTGFFIGGILKGFTVKETMNMASKAAGIAVTRMGAAPSIPDIREVIER